MYVCVGRGVGVATQTSELVGNAWVSDDSRNGQEGREHWPRHRYETTGSGLRPTCWPRGGECLHRRAAAGAGCWGTQIHLEQGHAAARTQPVNHNIMPWVWYSHAMVDTREYACHQANTVEAVAGHALLCCCSCGRGREGEDRRGKDSGWTYRLVCLHGLDLLVTVPHI